MFLQNMYATKSLQCCTTKDHSTVSHVHLLTENKIKCPTDYKRMHNSKMAQNKALL
jgi:hypothetical protein